MFSMKALILISLGVCFAQEVSVRQEPPSVAEESVRAEGFTGVSSSTDPSALVNFLTVLEQCARLLCKDPVVMTLSLLTCAYVVARMLFLTPTKQQPVIKQQPTSRKVQAWKAPSTADRVQVAASWRAEATAVKPQSKRPVRGKSQVAIQVNQQLMRLESTSEVLDCALAYTGQTDMVNVVTAIHRSAKLTKNRKQLATDERLVKLLDLLGDFFNQDQPVSILTRAVGNTSWALAKIQFACGEGSAVHPILDTLQTNFVKHATAFKPEELMNTVWAFAELRRESAEGQARALEVAKGAVACFERFPEFTLQQVVYFTWALGRLSGISCVRGDAEVRAGLALYAEKIVERVGSGVRTLTAKNLAMTAWGIAHLQLKISTQADVKGLLSEIADEACRRGMVTFGAGDLSSIMWGLNKSHVEHPAFYKALRGHLLRIGMGSFNNQDASSVISVCVGRAGWEKDTVFLQLLFDAAQDHAQGFSKLEKIAVQWAFSQVTHPMPDLQM